METYKNVSGNSGVVAYETDPNSIKVEFKDGAVYLYTYQTAGREHVEAMKLLAAAGEGLNRYINQHIQKGYAARLK